MAARDHAPSTCAATPKSAALKGWWRRLFSPCPILPAIACVIEMLEAEPERWRFGEHYAVHADGLRIWIGNRGKAFAWSREVWMPAYGIVFAKAPTCRPSRAHRALDRAVTIAEAVSAAAAIQHYFEGPQVSQPIREDQ